MMITITGGYGALAEGATDADLPDLPLDDDDDDEGGGLFDLKKLQTSLSENINKGYVAYTQLPHSMLCFNDQHIHFSNSQSCKVTITVTCDRNATAE